MKAAAILGLALALAYSVLAVIQMATVQTSLESSTSGALRLLVGNLTLVVVLVTALTAVGLVVASVQLLTRN